MCIINTNIQVVYEQDPRTGFAIPRFEPKTEITYQTVRTRIPSSIDYAKGLVLPLLLGGSFFLIRGSRRVSEEMADLAALIAATPEGLKTALTLADATSCSSKPQLHFHTASQGSLLPIHPSPGARLRQIDYYNQFEIGRLVQKPVKVITKQKRSFQM